MRSGTNPPSLPGGARVGRHDLDGGRTAPFLSRQCESTAGERATTGPLGAEGSHLEPAGRPAPIQTVGVSVETGPSRFGMRPVKKNEATSARTLNRSMIAKTFA